MAREPLLEIPFSAGIDQSQRAEVMDARAAFVALENGRHTHRGGYSKRWGFSAQTLSRLDATSRSAGYKLLAHGQQTCVIDGSTLDAYSTAASCNVSRGRVPECALSMMKAPSPPGGSGYLLSDACQVGNYLALAYAAGTSHYLAILDAQTGAVVRAPELAFTASVGESYPLLATYSTYVIAVFYDSGSSNLTGKYINTASAATITTGWQTLSTDIATDVKTGIPVTIGVESLSDRVAVVYVNGSAGASQVTVKTLDVNTIPIETQTIATGGVTPTAVAIEGSIADTLWVAWNQDTAVKVIGLDADVLATTLATTNTVVTVTTAPAYLGNIAIVSSSTAGAGRLFVNDGSDDVLRMCSFTTAAGAVSAGSMASARNVVFAGRPFRYGSRYYAPCRGYDTAENIAVLCDLSEANAWVRPVANVAPRIAKPGVNSCRVVAHSATEYWFPLAIQTTGTVYSAQIARFDFASSQRWQSIAHSGVTFLSGGLLTFFDGHLVREAGFVVRPPVPTTSLGGAGITGTNYRYVAVYEQVDAAGNWHVSGVSDPSTAVSPANQTVTVTVRGLGISLRISATTDPTVRISIYRTLTGGEPPYYYLTSLSNTLTAATQTYADTTTDANLSPNAKLYAPSLPGVNGSAQDRRAPPGLAPIVSYAGMLVGSQGEDVFYSGQDVSGEGTWFNPIFQVPVSGDGDITGLAAQDGTLYVFKRRAIFALAGSPPSDNGSSGGLGTPQRLAVDVGCIDARSIVVTSFGILFQSERGIELLSRGGQQVIWIGAKVQDEIASRPYVTSAKLDAAQGLVYFELASAETTNQVSGTGRTLVLDLTVQGADGLPIWSSIDRRTNQAGTADAPAQDGCVVWSGSAYRYAWLGTDGRVYIEDQTTHLDPGSAFVRQYGKAPWVHLAGIQGQQVVDRVLVLGEKHTDHDFTIRDAYDYSETFTTKAYDSAKVSAMPIFNVDRDLSQSQGQAVMVEFYDATPTGGGATVGTGKGATWVALTFSGEPKSGVKRTSSVLRGGV